LCFKNRGDWICNVSFSQRSNHNLFFFVNNNTLFSISAPVLLKLVIQKFLFVHFFATKANNCFQYWNARLEKFPSYFDADNIIRSNSKYKVCPCLYLFSYILLWSFSFTQNYQPYYLHTLLSLYVMYLKKYMYFVQCTSLLRKRNQLLESTSEWNENVLANCSKTKIVCMPSECKM
jgi:hypothetical protein